jgi:hypothetical protein
MPNSFWPAFAGFLLGSAQGLLLDWLRSRAQHRRQLRLLRSDLRRLVEFNRKWSWKHGLPAGDDSTPVPPRITATYQRLLQELDFWLTDEHSDDNSQLALINIADGASVLERYCADVHALSDKAKVVTSPKEKLEFLTRAIDTSHVYDRELDRWLTMVQSALKDVSRRLGEAGLRHQVWRSLRPMPKGQNPPALPPIGGLTSP